MVRATLTGRSGIFREDGSWELWGEPITQASYHKDCPGAWWRRHTAMLSGEGFS